ncbi:MAG: replicative DNA helicase [Anaerolineae bacterium]|nr:replicative DNA helicase [Anaerolineae bacterium]
MSNSVQPAIPYIPEAEEAVIGAVLINPLAYYAVASFLQADDFFLIRHQYIWAAFDRLVGRNEAIEYITVQTALRETGHLEEIGGPAYLTHLINSTPTSVHAEAYGRLVERAAVRRRLLVAADEIKALALDEEIALEEVVSGAESQLFNVTERRLSRDLVPMHQAINDYWERLELLMHADHRETFGLPTGFKDLDKLLGGFQKPDLLIFAGRPGMGKCVTGDTLVATQDGILPIAALKPAGIAGMPDEEGGTYFPLEIGVQTPDGLRQTAYFYDSGIKPTLKITTRAGYTLTGTHHHPVLSRSRLGRLIWQPLASLNPGDAIGLCPEALPESPFTWDTVVKIEDAGEQHCYDLTVPEGHAFVTNGIVSHNTSFMLSTAINMARLGARIAVFSLEMGVEQIVQRLVSMEAGINTQSLRGGNITPQEWQRFVAAAGNMSNFRIFIDDSPSLNPLQIRTKCLRMAREHGIDLVVVDYLQLMNAGGTYSNNRVQEISYISRSLKEMARELNVPVLSAAQLSRAVEQRQDKRPVLSDLRESGCLAGESLVYLPDSGQYVPIQELSGKTGFRVMSLNTDTWKLEPSTVSNAFCTGVKPVYRLTTQLGRSIRATANHKFLTITGWKRLDELTTSDHIALPRMVNGPNDQTMSNAELALLGHLIGDGCTLPNHAIQYTTRELDLAETVSRLATEIFGDEVLPRIHQEKGYGWYQVFLPTTRKITHGVHNPISEWLEELGVFGLRSYEKRIPDKVFAQPREAIALFLRHLWATDGCVQMKKTTHGHYPAVYYASSSHRLAEAAQALLLRLGINARLKLVSQQGKGRDQYHVIVTGGDDLALFVQCIQAVGSYKSGVLEQVQDYLNTHPSNTNRDIIPHAIWRMYAVPAMQEIGIVGRQMQAELGNAYCGTTLYKQNVSRERAGRLSQVVKSNPLALLAESDVYWDQIASIEPDGETEVYDLTVPGNSNFSAGNIIAHNSIEQDSDIVMFLYRDEVYNEATEFPNQADIIVAKHRNGPVGTISLYYEKTLTKFLNAAERNLDLSY